MGPNTKTSWGRFLKNCEIVFKNFVLLWYYLLGGLKKAPGRFDPAKMKKVLFIRHDKLGDMMISLPIFHNLKRIFPQLRIDLVCGKDNYDLIRTDPAISRVYYYRKNLLEDIRNIRAMRKEEYDCVVDLILDESVTATIMISLIAGSGFKLGVGKQRYAPFFDRTVRCERRKHHIIENTGRVLNLFGIDLKDCDLRPRIFLEEDDFAPGRKFVEELRTRYSVVAGVNLSAGRPGRTWPMHKYLALIQALLNEYPHWIFVLNYAPSEYGKAEEVRATCPERVIPIPRGLSIRQVAGLLSCLNFLITPDTSLTHLASAFDLPSLVMFSGDNANFTEWGPYNPRIRAIRSPDHNQIEQIEPQAVFEAFARLVKEEQERSGRTAK